MLHRFAGRYFLDAGMGLNALQEYVRSFRSCPKIAFEEWHRILFSGLSTLGLGFLRKPYYRFKDQRFSHSKFIKGIENVDRLYTE